MFTCRHAPPNHGGMQMATSMTAEDIDHPRRRFLGIMAATIAAADLGIVAAADAQSDSVVRPSVTSGAITSFAPLKQINAGLGRRLR